MIENIHMKRLGVFLSVLMFLAVPFFVQAEKPLKYIDAKELELLGKGFRDTQNYYERLPASLEEKTRPAVWNLSKDCSGMAVRFRTNSPVIAAKWEVLKDITMNHFAPSGIKGLDLYCFKNGKWEFVKSALPSGKNSSVVIISNMDSIEREYMLFLPLYDGLVNLEIGVEETAQIGLPQMDLPRKDKPVIFYGTSITQGGCATRAGMSYPNILARMLNRQIINLGFSGNGKLDLEIAEAMATIDASCFVIDCLPNVDVDLMREKFIPFIETIREKHPKTPILLIENIYFPYIYFDNSVYAKIGDKNLELKKIYDAQKQKGDKNIYLMKAKSLIGTDNEGTVDGVHLTDLGFLRMSQALYPVISRLIK